MVTEKQLFTELLLLYKDMPCLWDSREVEYSVKEARDQAYEKLLEKYQEINEGATLMDLKTKIEYMRAAYRREHKKVLLSRLRADTEVVEEYTPTLWYYDLLTFLNDVSDFSRLEPKRRKPDKEPETEEPKSKKKRQKKRKYPTIQTVYFSESNESINSDDHDDDNTEDNAIQIKQEGDQNSCSSLPSNNGTECESFGATIGFQLKDLDRMQRAIAEKLISEIIFDARFKKLTVNSKVIHT